MKNYKELEIRCRAFTELQGELKEMKENYIALKETYVDRDYSYAEEQRGMFDVKIATMEKLLEQLDKLF